MISSHPLAPHFSNLAAIPDYARAIPNLVDLTVLGQRLRAGAYATSGAFVADGRRIWGDIIRVVQPGTELYSMCAQMGNYFEKLVNGLGNVPLEECVERKSGGSRKGPLTSQEKFLLKQNIMLLPENKLQGVVEIVQSSVGASKNTETLEFDIDKLSASVARALDEYVKQSLPKTRKASAPPKKRNVQPTLTRRDEQRMQGKKKMVYLLINY
eukprot:TRINITY_DN1702_c0_g2_i1.p1 TRINITY_DN1702_c0_g2~~TRINITY_DN1702_c0_g2_i1.p1  ORF type:complete len:212 (+),score=70.82 TRINITY_DN1702_c0_g2_i1:603-1238(+)